MKTLSDLNIYHDEEDGFASQVVANAICFAVMAIVLWLVWEYVPSTFWEIH